MGKITDLARKRFWNTEIFELIESEFKALEKDYRYHQEWLIGHTEDIRTLLKESFPLLEIQGDVPTDKDRPFQVGDTIALCGYSDIRIVLEVKSNNLMQVMNVPNGNIQEGCYPEQYTLVYRPGSPKPEPTVKEKIDTDKFRKMDVIVRVDGPYKNEPYIVVDVNEDGAVKPLYPTGTISDGFSSAKYFRLVYRPRFPDRKER